MNLVSSSVPKDVFLQGYVDRESHYLCCPCWGFYYNKGVKFKLGDVLEDFDPIDSRFDIIDL
jgi:hypothetical protein